MICALLPQNSPPRAMAIMLGECNEHPQYGSIARASNLIGVIIFNIWIHRGARYMLSNYVAITQCHPFVRLCGQ